MTVLQRRRVESFLVEARPWALRQARKKYPHLPADLYEDVYQQACVEMLRGNPRAGDRPGLYAYLSRVLTGVLGRVHKQWCHQHLDINDEDGPIEVADPGFSTDDTIDNRQLGAVLNELMNRSLLAPERAVLQLQLGVGLDPDQIKDALDMSDRQYKRRRYEGVQKLREALDDYLSGRVCEEHAGRLAMAASGELTAGGLEELNAHLDHCGGCRAEIRELRRTVSSRMALAPWPLLIGAPGAVAAKLSAAVALVKGGASLGGTKAAVAALAATAAVAAGSVAVTSVGDEPARPSAVPQTSAPAQQTSAGAPAAAPTGVATTRGSASTKSTRSRKAKRERSSSRESQTTRTGSDSVWPTSSGSGSGVTARDTVGKALDATKQTVGQAKRKVRKTVDGVQGAVPLPGPVQNLTDGLQDALDSLAAPAGE